MTWNRSPSTDISWTIGAVVAVGVVDGLPAWVAIPRRCLLILYLSRWSLYKAFCRRVSSIALFRIGVSLSKTDELINCMWRSRFVTQPVAECKGSFPTSLSDLLGQSTPVAGFWVTSFTFEELAALFKKSERFLWGLVIYLPARPLPRLYGPALADLQDDELDESGYWVGFVYLCWTLCAPGSLLLWRLMEPLPGQICQADLIRTGSSSSPASLPIRSIKSCCSDIFRLGLLFCCGLSCLLKSLAVGK